MTINATIQKTLARALGGLVLLSLFAPPPAIAKTKKARQPAGPRVLIFEPSTPTATPAVVVEKSEPQKIDAPVFYVTIGSEEEGAHTGKVEVEERTMTIEPGKTKSPAK